MTISTVTMRTWLWAMTLLRLAYAGETRIIFLFLWRVLNHVERRVWSLVCRHCFFLEKAANLISSHNSPLEKILCLLLECRQTNGCYLSIITIISMLSRKKCKLLHFLLDRLEMGCIIVLTLLRGVNIYIPPLILAHIVI